MKRFLILLFILNSVAFAQEWVEQEGVRFHSSCQLKFGEQFQDKVVGGLKEGVSCLNRLGTPKSFEHANAISELISSKKLSIGCHYDRYFKNSSAVATASLSPKDNVEDIGLKFPFLTFNPKEADWLLEENNLNLVAFHEVFHNIGYAHGRTEEYAYACEGCCFTGDSEFKELACKICSTKYDGLKDPEYIKDLVKFHGMSHLKRSYRTEIAIRLGLMQNPTSVPHREFLLSFDGKGNALSMASAKSWADQIKSEFILSTAGQSYSDAEKKIETLISKAYQARRELLLENNVRSAIQSYLQINVADLRNYFAVDPEYAGIFWDAVLYDLDALIEINKIEEKYDLSEILEKYDEILAAKPRDTTNQ